MQVGTHILSMYFGDQWSFISLISNNKDLFYHKNSYSLNSKEWLTEHGMVWTVITWKYILDTSRVFHSFSLIEDSVSLNLIHWAIYSHNLCLLFLLRTTPTSKSMWLRSPGQMAAILYLDSCYISMSLTRSAKNSTSWK